MKAIEIIRGHKWKLKHVVIISHTQRACILECQSCNTGLEITTWRGHKPYWIIGRPKTNWIHYGFNPKGKISTKFTCKIIIMERALK